MNNATASLQSTVSFLLLTTLCSTISPSHMHTLGRGMAEKKGSALSAAQHNKYTKCFIVLPTGEKKVAVPKWAAMVWICCSVHKISDSYCFVALFRVCQNWHSGEYVVQSLHMLLFKKHSHSNLKSRYNFRAWLQGQRAQCEAHGDKVQHNMLPVGERWPRCIRQDQPLRNTSVPLF